MIIAVSAKVKNIRHFVLFTTLDFKAFQLGTYLAYIFSMKIIKKTINNEKIIIISNENKTCNYLYYVVDYKNVKELFIKIREDLRK